MPDQPTTRRWWQLAQPLVASALSFACVAVLAVNLDVFGLEPLKDTRLQDTLVRAFGWLYQHRETMVQPREPVVVLIDDRTLMETRTAWPVPYGFHAKMLRTMLRAKPRPKAVFFDLMFPDRREDDTLADLVGTLRRYRRLGIKVYFACGTTSACDALRPALQLENGEAPDGDATKRHGRLAIGVPVPKAVEGDGLTRQYPLFTDEATPVETAALRLYLDEVRESSSKTIVERDDPYTFPLEIMWGFDPHPQQAILYPPACVPPSPLATAIGTLFGEGVEQPCPYTLSVRAEDVASQWSAQHRAVPAGPQRGALKDALDAQYRNVLAAVGGRVVFYGADLQGSGDHVRTPPRGQVPGVFMHAMAFDNLVRWPANYVRRQTIFDYGFTNGPRVRLSRADFVALALAALGYASARRQQRTGWRARLSAVARLLIPIVSGLVLFEYFGDAPLHVAPLMMIGVAGEFRDLRTDVVELLRFASKKLRRPKLEESRL